MTETENGKSKKTVADMIEQVVESKQPDYTQSTETVRLTPEQEKARGRRNVVIALSLVGFMVAVFAITVVRLSQNIAAGVAS
ncbi:hypothetical protein [Maricaulis sp.]|uniref:hypothetical protein n=1 Tax=Maricaulis sp. TaxID=1486257 RepID=UPI0025C48D74|nr:hypothetical protein [Maricaulis sp.]